MVTVDESGRIVLVNSQTEQMFGYNRDELIGQQIEILMPERFHGAHHAHRTSFLSDPRTRSMGAELDLVARRQDGSEFPADISLSPLHPSSTADDLLVTAIIRDITERRRWEAERAQLAGEQARRREAEQAIRQREEFLTIAAHELKTPLTSVKAAAQFLVRLLDSPSDTPPDLRRPAQQLTSQVARMESLVADLLDASRLQLGRLPMSPEPIDLIPLIQQVIDQFTSAAEQTPARRIVVDAPSSVTGAWDPARLDQVLTNLISNALKYSPAGGEVRITVRCHADEIDVSVADRGIGIAPEDQTGLFQPFARGSTPSRTVSGTGLGLYNSNQIVRRHGGQIRVERQMGVGSTVSFHLP
ncbi:MAG: ATP-binding protein, partial [Thermomicrobiales bacterium]